MQFANYNEFRSAVLRMIDGDDVSTTFSLDTLDLLIALGETRVYLGDAERSTPGLRTRDMDVPLSLTVTANAATLPTDCIELKRVQFSGEMPLDYADQDDVLRRLEVGGTGPSRYYTQQGNSLIFYPEASGTVGGRYYQRLPDIKTGGLHATFNRYPEVFLYSALAESAPFLGEDARLPLWKTIWANSMNAANSTERNLAERGSRLTQKVR